jgi:hypothetical protein
MEFDPFGLFVKDLLTRNVIVRSIALARCTRCVYRGLPLHQPVPWPSLLLHHTPLLLSLLPRSIVISVILALTPYLAYLGLPLFTVPAINMSFVMHVS